MTLLMFISLWLAVAKDLRAAIWLHLAFGVFLLATAVFHIDYIYLIPIAVIFVGFAIYAIFSPWKKYAVERQPRTFQKKWFGHPLEAISYHSFVWIFKMLPLPVLSWLGGKVLETVGPYTKANKIAARNLSIIWPEHNNPKFLKKMWNNWGRVFVEGLKFKTYLRNMDKYIEFQNRELFDKMNREGRPYIVSIPHSGNMGVTTLSFLEAIWPVGITYKFPSNPLMNDVLLSNYGAGIVKEVEFIPVGNAVSMLRVLRGDGVLNINSDQRINGADILKFFGYPARTSTGVARFALKLNIPVLICHMERVRGAKCRICYDEVLHLPKTGDVAADELVGMQMVNDALERSARHSPSEYLWMHRRWGHI